MLFRSPEVKRSATISNKHGIYELSHALPNDLRFRILGNYETSRKPQGSENYNLLPGLPPPPPPQEKK